MKLKLKKSQAYSHICYPDRTFIETSLLWDHLFPDTSDERIEIVVILARAHNWEIEWMKD